MPFSFSSTYRRLYRMGLLAASLAPLAAPALAQGRMEAKYRLSLAGLEIGKASLTAEIGDSEYSLIGTGRVAGLMRALSSGKGSAAARGVLSQVKISPRLFAVSAEAGGKPESIRFAMTPTGVTDLVVDPPTKPAADRIEITEANLVGVIDPLSGAFPQVPGPADPLSAAACKRTIPVFDGRQRFDLALSFERLEPVKIEKGFSGTAVVCQVRYIPVAGHRPTRSAIKYMRENKDIRIWLVPVAGTRVLAPFKVSVDTPVGNVELEATSFMTEAKASVPPK